MNNEKCFEYRLQVSFEDTNVVGNVYFANYFVWQGRCREAFLAQHAPRVLVDFKNGHGMITKDSSCKFLSESFAFDNIVIQMKLGRLSRTLITMEFEYFREEDNKRTLVAKGKQSAFWASPDSGISVLPSYLYDTIVQFSND